MSMCDKFLNKPLAIQNELKIAPKSRTRVYTVGVSWDEPGLSEKVDVTDFLTIFVILERAFLG